MRAFGVKFDSHAMNGSTPLPIFTNPNSAPSPLLSSFVSSTRRLQSQTNIVDRFNASVWSEEGNLESVQSTQSRMSDVSSLGPF